MLRTDGVAVFPVNNAIGAIVQAVGRSDVDTVMVAGAFRKRAGKLIDIDLTKLAADVSASREYLVNASGYRPDLFKTSAPAPAAA
jgi:5-methylthioadenosine/S-adenosylhomocysteine deaminase